MDSSHWPLILIEGILVFGGALAFGWWQLRSVRRDREAMLKRREEEAQAFEVGHPSSRTIDSVRSDATRRDGAS